MAISGRKPKPIEQRLKEGADSHHKPLPEPVLVAGRPDPDELSEPPEDLSADGKRMWRRDIQRLIDVGICDRVDFAALEGMCTAYARAKQAGRVVNKVGHYTVGSRGQPIQHPALRIERESWSQFMSFAEHFAMTPVARTRLGLAEVHRRTLQAEIGDALGRPNLEVIDGDG